MDESVRRTSDHSEIPRTLDYASRADRRKSPTVRLFEICSIVGVLALLVSILMPNFSRSHGDRPNVVVCNTNLQELLGYLRTFANSHGGKYPHSFQTLVLNSPKRIPSRLFVCPASDADEAPDTSPAELVKNLTNDPVHYLSYIYAASGLSTSSSPDCVLVYELLTNHGDRADFLFADGRVVLTQKPQAEKLIAELQGGHNPPRPEMLK